MTLLLSVLRVALSLALLIVALAFVRNYRRSRTAPYFILRRAAAVRAWRWLLVALGLSMVLVVSLRIKPRGAADELLPPMPPAAAPETAPPPPTTYTPLPAPTLTAKPFSEGPPDLSLTLTPPGANAPERAATLQGGASISMRAVSTEIEGDYLPKNSGTTFPAGVPRFYVFFDFEGMSNGVLWSGSVLINEQVFEDASFEQVWSLGEEGTNWWRSFDQDGGWPAGEYEVRFYVGDEQADSVTFRMVGGSAATPQATAESTP